MLQVVIQVAKRLECGAVIKYNWELTQFVFSDRLQSPPPPSFHGYNRHGWQAFLMGS